MFLTNIIAYAIIIGRFKAVAEKYPRGRRGSPAKGVVREKRSQGSNPCFSAKKPSPKIRVGLFFVEKVALINGVGELKTERNRTKHLRKI